MMARLKDIHLKLKDIHLKHPGDPRNSPIEFYFLSESGDFAWSDCVEAHTRITDELIERMRSQAENYFMQKEPQSLSLEKRVERIENLIEMFRRTE
jgi:hypothetical protein